MKKVSTDKKSRAQRIVSILRKRYPSVTTALSHSSSLDILIATILSAQCTDRQVNIVTGELFRNYKSADDYTKANRDELERIIKPTGFYHAKARNIIACCKALIERHNGVVPQTMEELTQLPGVGRKTANVVLSNYFGKAVGIVVDTHVKRISVRLGFTTKTDPEKIEIDLMKIILKKYWIDYGNIIIQHGRNTCQARKPLCNSCPIKKYCPSREE
jgi:endonuclease III